MPSRFQPAARSWRGLLFAVCVAQAFAIVGFDFTLPFIPLYLQHDLGIRGVGETALWAGLIGFGPAIPATIFGPIWGRLADRFGYRAMLLRAMIASAILLSLMAFVPSPGVLLALRMVQGALSGTVFSAQALVAASVPEEETGRSMGLLQMSISGGAMLGPVGGGLVAQIAGFRPTFVCAGVLLALATVIVFRFVWEPERRVVQAGSEDEAKQPSIFGVLKIPAFASALAFCVVVYLAATALLPVIPLMVQDLLHNANNVPGDTGWLMAVSGLCSAGGSYMAGRLYGRFGLGRIMPVCLALSSLLLFPQAFAGSFVVFLVLRAAVSLALGGLFSMIGTWAAISSPKHAKGTAFGLVAAASSLGFGSGPLLGGVVADAIGVRPVFLLSAIVLGLMPVALLFWKGSAALWRARPAPRLAAQRD